MMVLTKRVQCLNAALFLLGLGFSLQYEIPIFIHKNVLLVNVADTDIEKRKNEAIVSCLMNVFMSSPKISHLMNNYAISRFKR